MGFLQDFHINISEEKLKNLGVHKHEKKHFTLVKNKNIQNILCDYPLIKPPTYLTKLC